MAIVERPELRIPAPIRRSRLMQLGGFVTCDGLLGDPVFRDLSDEAISRRDTAIETVASASDGEEWRGGSPARRFRSAAGGDVQTAFYRDRATLDVLVRLCGVSLRPSGSQGSFTYYARAGDHLDIHRDINRCDLTVITCLQETHPDAMSGKLVVYPDRLNDPLSAIRATPEEGCLPQGLSPGQSILLFGGIVPHQIVPTAEDQLRIVSILCYEAVLD